MSSTEILPFTESVKAIQARKGSRHIYAQMEQNGGWQTHITPELVSYLAAQRSFFLATSNADGQPYIQHRGGPPGFLKVIDDKTLAFADYTGNKQYISQGNLIDNAKAFIFLINYSNKTRVKIWGRASVIEDRPDVLAELMPDKDEYRASPEQIIVFTVDTWDKNCPQHIPRRFEQEEVEELLLKHKQHIAKLEEQIRQLQEKNDG